MKKYPNLRQRDIPDMTLREYLWLMNRFVDYAEQRDDPRIPAGFPAIFKDLMKPGDVLVRDEVYGWFQFYAPLRKKMWEQIQREETPVPPARGPFAKSRTRKAKRSHDNMIGAAKNAFINLSARLIVMRLKPAS